MKNFLTSFFDFFLPRFCPSCNKKLTPDEEVICPDCFSKIKLADKQRIDHEFKRKFFNKGIIKDFTSLFVFEKDKELQSLIHSVKYKQRFLNGKFLGTKVGENLTNEILNWSIDFIIPVPLHHLKKAERQFNQSYYIAIGLSKIVNIPARKNFVKRVRYTESQTTMTLTEREANIRDAFKVKSKKKIQNKNLLLVDDVITTGATLSECGRKLKEAGANNIFGISVAIAD